MNWLISDYLASYRDRLITPDRLREDLSNPEIISQEDLADHIMDAFDRWLLAWLPPKGYYDRIKPRSQ